MILIITGPPGSCKTLYTVAELMHKRFAGREFLVNGIPGLLVPHQLISDEDVMLWHKGGVAVVQPTTVDEEGNVIEHAPVPSFDVKNKVIFIDEIQRLARPRPASQKPPDWIAALEVHRHYGVDIVVITQHPQLIDVNIRRLCGQHIHMRRMWGRARAITYTWDHCGSPESPKTAQIGTWGYKKWAYKLYKSAEAHTKSGIKMPPVVYLLGACLIALPISMYFTSHRLLTRFTGSEGPTVSATVPGAKPGAPGVMPGQIQPGATAATPAPAPRIRDMHDPGDRPMYDDKREIVAAPRVAGCIRTVKLGCTCYTQNATPVAMPKDMCEDRLAVPKFDPYAAMWPTGRGSPSFPLSTVPEPPAAPQQAEVSGSGYGLRDAAFIAAVNNTKAKTNAPAAR
jgi:zona occludens toxin